MFHLLCTNVEVCLFVDMLVSLFFQLEVLLMLFLLLFKFIHNFLAIIFVAKWPSEKLGQA